MNATFQNVGQIGSDPIPLDFQSNASTKLASIPFEYAVRVELTL